MGSTIIDIAKMANTSKSTVSRYLNGGKINEETAREIDAVIKKIGYRPNINARRLVLNKSYVLGVVLDDIANTYYSSILSGIQTVAGKSEYTCTFYSRAPFDKKESDYLRLFQEGQIDGLILGTFQNREKSEIEKLHKSGYPIVLIGTNNTEIGMASIDVDNFMGTADVVKYLYSMGHRRIACLRGPQTMSGAKLRTEGYLYGMRNCGLETDERLVADTEWTVEGGFKSTTKLLETCDFTAIICSNEYCAYGAIKAIQSKGKSVPDDISVVGFDDGVLAQLTKPGITTVRQPFFQLGKIAIAQLVELIENKNASKTNILLKPELICRESCKKLEGISLV